MNKITNKTSIRKTAFVTLFALWACQSANDKLTALADEYCACPDEACATAAKEKSIALYEKEKDKIDQHVLRKITKKVNACRKKANAPVHNESPVMRRHRISKGCIKVCEKAHKDVFSTGYKTCMGTCTKNNGL
jgi:hypothetical protein